MVFSSNRRSSMVRLLAFMSAAASPSLAASDVVVRRPETSISNGRSLNSIDTIISDMREMNDLPLVGVPTRYGWAKGPGHVVMGNDTRGSSTPSWWVPANPVYKSAAYWNAVIPWFVVFDGLGNKAVNTRVQVRNIRLFILSRKSMRWTQIGASVGAEGYLYPKHLTGSDVGRPNLRTESDGSTSIRPPGGDLVFHGWCCGRMTIVGADVRAVFVTLQARLIPDALDRPDDTDRARYLIHVGADYYPDSATLVAAFAPTGYNPGVGVSRAKLVKPAWQAFNFATIAAGVESTPGTSLSLPLFRSTPPPLE
jgi:hypothetical protein